MPRGLKEDDHADRADILQLITLRSNDQFNTTIYSYDDRYRGESILIHEFGHTMLVMGLDAIEPKFRSDLHAAYSDAIAKGLFKNTYAATNADEYWAEGVQDWFDANLKASRCCAHRIGYVRGRLPDTVCDRLLLRHIHTFARSNRTPLQDSVFTRFDDRRLEMTRPPTRAASALQ